MFPKSLITKQTFWITQTHIHTHTLHYWRWWGTRLSTQTPLSSWQNAALIHRTTLQVNSARPSLDHQNVGSNYSQALHLYLPPMQTLMGHKQSQNPDSLDRPRSEIVSISTQFSLKDPSIWNFLTFFRIIWILTTMEQFIKDFWVL